MMMMGDDVARGNERGGCLFESLRGRLSLIESAGLLVKTGSSHRLIARLYGAFDQRNHRPLIRGSMTETIHGIN